MSTEKGYKSKENANRFRQNQMFTVKPNDKVSFFYVPLQIPLGGIIGRGGVKHLFMRIECQHEPCNNFINDPNYIDYFNGKYKGKVMSIGFYPKGGDILGSIINPQDGFVWTPDPYDIPMTPGFEPAVFYRTNQPIVYQLTLSQADELNHLLYSEKCMLKDGSTSRGKIKRDRLECPEKTYATVSKIKCNSYNCVSWLFSLFPRLGRDIYGGEDYGIFDLFIQE